MPGSSFCSSGPPEGSIVERPTRVRVQSTLLPSEAQRLEAYHKHEVAEGDSIQKLAIKYRVSVAAIKAANKMIADDVIGFSELWVPKQRNGPTQELSRMITVLPSVSWQSFLRQISAAHGLSQGSVGVQCLSKVTVDTYGHAQWVSISSTAELAEELANTKDANRSKDFLRVRVQERQAEEGEEADPLADKLTYDSTMKRNASTVKKDAEDAEAEDEYVAELQDERDKRPMPQVVVRSPHPALAARREGGGGGGSCWLCRFTLCCFQQPRSRSVRHPPPHFLRAREKSARLNRRCVGQERSRRKFIQKNEGEEMEAASLLKFEQAYVQE